MCIYIGIGIDCIKDLLNVEGQFYTYERFREQYDIQESGEFFDEVTLAMDDIATGAAGALVTSILEGF